MNNKGSVELPLGTSRASTILFLEKVWVLVQILSTFIGIPRACVGMAMSDRLKFDQSEMTEFMWNRVGNYEAFLRGDFWKKKI